MFTEYQVYKVARVAIIECCRAQSKHSDRQYNLEVKICHELIYGTGIQSIFVLCFFPLLSYTE